jgi:hypothetical protein
MNSHVTILFLAALFVASCKNPQTTNGPLSPDHAGERSDSKSAGKQMVVGTTDVPLEEVPRLTLSIDVSDCVGAAGRWLDPANPSSSRVGAVSVSPTRTGTTNVSTQPAPWVFEPTRETAEAPIVAKGSQSWRLERGSYSLDVIAYNVESSAKESNLNKPFDFSLTNDLTLSVLGTWTSSKCVLSWK